MGMIYRNGFLLSLIAQPLLIPNPFSFLSVIYRCYSNKYWNVPLKFHAKKVKILAINFDFLEPAVSSGLENSQLIVTYSKWQLYQIQSCLYYPSLSNPFCFLAKNIFQNTCTSSSWLFWSWATSTHFYRCRWLHMKYVPLSLQEFIHLVVQSCFSNIGIFMDYVLTIIVLYFIRSYVGYVKLNTGTWIWWVFWE